MSTAWLVPFPWLFTAAQEVGFDALALLDLDALRQDPGLLAVDAAALDKWLAAGAHAGMCFMEGNRAARTDAAKILPKARSALVFFVPYATGRRARAGTGGPEAVTEHAADRGMNGEDADPVAGIPQAHDSPSQGVPLPGDRLLGQGLVARYAHGSDYHKALRRRLNRFAATLKPHLGPDLAYRAITDSAPWLERAHARAAGLGFVGKNTMLIRPGLGSYGFLASLLLDAAPDALGSTPARAHPLAALDCGDCRLCLDACPTEALPREYFVDATRCLAYLSIEHRGGVPEVFQPHFRDTLFGCDACQEACPYNLVTRDLVRLPEFKRPNAAMGKSVIAIARMNAAEYERWFGGTAMTRAKYQGLVRNALYSLKSSADPRLASVLKERWEDPLPEIRSFVREMMSK